MAQREHSRRAPSPLNLVPRSPPPLLYDLPTGFSSTSPTSSHPAPRSPRSPPRTPRGRAQGLISPTAQTFSSLGPRTSVLQPVPLPHQQAPLHSKQYQQHAYGIQSPNRSTSGTPTQELEVFAALCRAWYFQQDPEADARIQETLRTIPASQRASYTRLQSHIRSSYHTAIALRKASEFHAHITSTRPGQSLSLLNRQNPTSAASKEERLSRFRKLVETWATSGNVGTKPFFDGLFAVLRLQTLPENLGGAGRHRMEWEIDDAVFQESAGKEFMLEAIDVLKGVLGFEESIRNQREEAIQPSSKTGPALRPNESSVSPPTTPPPLPSRSSLNTKGRPTLRTITSGSTIDMTTGPNRASRISNIQQPDRSSTLLDDNERDTFADPIQQQHSSITASRRRAASSSSAPPIPPRIKKSAAPRSEDAMNEWGEDENNRQLNRNRSPSDPFSDTHGHFTFGRHAHARHKGQSSTGDVFDTADPSPFSTPFANGGSSVGTSTTGSDSLLADRESKKSSQRHHPLPPEDFELETTKLPQNTLTADVLSPDSDEEDDTLLGDSQHLDTGIKSKSEKRSSIAFKKRRASEPMGLGLLDTEAAGQLWSPTRDNLDAMTASTLTAAVSRPMSISGQPNFMEQTHMRTWIAPSYLGNPEIAKLLATFPASISRGAVPRFKVTAASKSGKHKTRRREGDPEAQLQAAVSEDDGETPKEAVRHGTGKMWIGSLDRDEGWGGTLWERFIGWWRRIFC